MREIIDTLLDKTLDFFVHKLIHILLRAWRIGRTVLIRKLKHDLRREGEKKFEDLRSGFKTVNLFHRADYFTETRTVEACVPAGNAVKARPAFHRMPINETASRTCSWPRNLARVRQW